MMILVNVVAFICCAYSFHVNWVRKSPWYITLLLFSLAVANLGVVIAKFFFGVPGV